MQTYACCYLAKSLLPGNLSILVLSKLLGLADIFREFFFYDLSRSVPNPCEMPMNKPPWPMPAQFKREQREAALSDFLSPFAHPGVALLWV